MTHRLTLQRAPRALLATAAVTIALLLAACSGTSTTSSSGKTLTPVKYQLSWLKITQFGGFFAADKEGFYSDEGVAPTFTAGGSNILAWQQVAGGAALLGDEDNTLLLEAIAKGEPLVVIGAVFQKSPMAIMSLDNDPITTAKALEGKTIAYPDNGIAQLKSALTADGVDVSKVTIVPAGADPTQLVTHQVAGYGGYATSQGASLEVQGLKVHYLYVDDITGVPSYGNVIVTTKANLKDPTKRTTIKEFMTAAVKGYEWMNANPEAAAKIVVNDVNPTGGLKLATETQTAKIQASLIDSKSGVLRVNDEQMQKFIDSLVAAGTITTKLDAKNVVDTSVLDEVYGSSTNLLK